MLIKWSKCNAFNYFSLIMIVSLLMVLCQSQYCNQSSNGTVSCFSCFYRCKQCSGLTKYDCISCTKEYLLVNGTCESCGDNCFSCKTFTDTSYLSQLTIEQQCETCIEGYFLYQSTGKCIKCPLGAQTCTLSTIQSCSDGYCLLNGVCTQCQSNCMSCSDSVTCTNCNEGFYLNSTGVCLNCPISNCVSCPSITNCDRCFQGYSGNNCEYVCEEKCGICYSGVCFVCKEGFYMLNGSCELGRVLCGIGSSYSECSECVNDIASLGVNNLCIPFFTVHDQNRLIFLTALNNNDSFSSYPINNNSLNSSINYQSNSLSLCPQLSTYVSTSSTGYVSVFTQIDPSYKITLKAQLFANSLPLSLDVYVNDLLLNSSLISIVNGVFAYQCGNNSFYILDVNCAFPLSDNFNSSNSNLIISFNVSLADPSSFLVGISELLLQLHRCRVSNCLFCKSAYTCQTCVYPFKLQNNECINSCSEGYYLTESNTKITCSLECSQGYFPIRQDYTCKQCSYPCVQCQDDSICSKCYHLNISQSTSNSAATMFFLYNSSCVSTCPQKYFADTQTFQCQECVFPCQECISFDKCTSCKIGYLNSDNYSCVAKCSQGQYSDFLQLKCLPCQTPCFLCQYSPLACVSCLQPYYLLSKNSSCLSECPSGYAKITSTLNECKQCDFPCKNCQNSEKNCTSCIKGYLYKNECFSECPSGFYKSTNLEMNNVCVLCENNCFQCLDKEICISCQQGFKFNVIDKNCVVNCPKSTYSSVIDQISSTNKTVMYECLQCVPPCYECENASYCLSCTGLLFLNHLGQCLLECPLGTYIFYNSTLEERQCLLCASNCIDCLSETSCNECKDGWLLFEGLCFSKCPEGTFANQKGYKYCEYCENPCMQCLNEYQCVSCMTGFILQVDSMRCVEYCSEGYFESLTSTNPITNLTVNNFGSLTMTVCLVCSVECEGCVNVRDNCSSCAEGYFYDNVKKVCSKDCPDGSYRSQSERKCNLCEYPCKKCESYLSCLSCYSESQISNTSLVVQEIFYLSKCIEQCPMGYFVTIDLSDVITCQKCAFPCEECSIKQTNCTKCKLPSLTFYNLSSVNYNTLQCVSQCPLTYFQDFYVCKPCVQPCQWCKSDNQCMQCIEGWYLLEGQCYQNYCPFHYFKTVINATGLCIKCDDNCRECSGSSTNCSSCVGNFYLLQSQSSTIISQPLFTCTKQCPSMFYESSSTMECLECQNPCLQCYSKNYCITCNINYIMQMNKCVSSCSETFYLQQINSKQCLQCESPCEKCIDSLKCQSCVAGYYFMSDNYSCVTDCPSKMYGHKVQIYSQSVTNNFKGLCLNCSQLCQECSSFSVCISCNQTNERKYLESGRCQSSCSEGFYPSTDLNAFYQYQCLECQTNCVSCTTYETCTKCVSSFLYENKCISTCPSLFYGSSGLKCQKCESPCRECFNEYNCIDCVEGFYLYKEICVKHCPQSLWSDSELRECVSECATGKFCNVGNKSCVRECERFYSWEAECVDECWGLNGKEYLINSTKGCESCADQNQCRKLYDQLSFELENIVEDGKLILMAKFSEQMVINTNYSRNQNTSSNLDNNTSSDFLGSLINMGLSEKDFILEEISMQFIQENLLNTIPYAVSSSSLILKNNLDDSAIKASNMRLSSIVSVPVSLDQLIRVKQIVNISQQQQIPNASQQQQLINVSQQKQNTNGSYFTPSKQPQKVAFSSDQQKLTNNSSSIKPVSLITDNLSSINQQSLDQYLFLPDILWLQLQSLPQSQQSFSGALAYQLQNYEQLLSKSTYQLSPQSSEQNLPLQSIALNHLQIQSFSPNRKMPQWLNQLAQTIGKILSFIILTLITVNLIFDNLKSQFHLIDTAQNLYLLLWISNQLELGISPFLKGFHISAFIFSLSPTYGSDGYKEVLQSLQNKVLSNCSPKQLIYGNSCQFTDYFITLLPFIAVFIVSIIICKIIMHFKPFISNNLKIHHEIIYNHINNFYWLFNTPIFFIATSSFILQNKDSTFSIMNFILIIFIVILTLILAYQILKNIFNCSFQQKTFFWGLKCHKLQNQQANIHFLLIMIRKSIIFLAAALGISSSNRQLVFIFLLVFVSIIILSNILANSPFKKRFYQYILVACEVLLILFYLALQIYIVSVKNFDETIFIIFNTGIFLIALSVVVLHSTIAFIETFNHLKKKYQQYKSLEQINGQQSKSSSYDTSENMSRKKLKSSQKSIKSDHNQFILLPASLEKLKGSNQNLKIKQQQNNNQNTQNEERETKHQKLNNSEDSRYESSSGFEFHSAQNSEQFEEPAKYLIKLQKNPDNEQKSKN